MLAMGPTGFITLLAGWVTTEAGRQPWVVYGVMRTAQAVSPVTPQDVGVSLMVFVIVYFLVFGTGIYYMLKLLRSGRLTTMQRRARCRAPMRTAVAAVRSPRSSDASTDATSGSPQRQR